MRVTFFYVHVTTRNRKHVLVILMSQCTLAVMNDNVNKRKVEIVINKNLPEIFLCCCVKIMINDDNDK